MYPSRIDFHIRQTLVAKQHPNDSTEQLFDHHMPRARTAMGVVVMKLERDPFRREDAHARQTVVRCASFDFARSTTMTSPPTSPELAPPTTPRPIPIDLLDRGEEGYYVRVQGNVLLVSDFSRTGPP